MHPSQFAVNQCWLIVKASDAPVQTGEGAFEVYVLQDAASMYIFGNLFVPAGGGTAIEEEVNSLLHDGWRKKREWPQSLSLSDSVPFRSSLAVVAKRIRISVKVVPESELAFYTNDVQAGFREYFGPEESGAV
jgi:hypothetical protein